MPRLSEDTDIMASPSSDTSSGENRVEDQLVGMDIENNSKEGGARRPRLVIHLWRIPLPLRKGHLASDLVKHIAWIMTVL